MSEDYTVTDHGGLYLLVNRLTGAQQLFESRLDAEREGERLAAYVRCPPRAWMRSDLARGEYPIPYGERPSSCASCGAAIVWTRADNAPVPLSLARARFVNGRRVAMNHFVDCPDGKEWQTKE